MMLRWACLAGTALVVTIVAGPALGDVAPNPLAGGTSPHVHGDPTSVAMTWEKVEMVVTGDKVLVTAVFGLTNTGDAETLQVGFPTFRRYALRDFTAEVDGKSVPVTRNKGWHLWSMDFADKEARTVKVRYWNEPVEDSRANQRLDEIPCKDPEGFEETFRRFKAHYVLYTGAGWRGPIGTAEIAVRFEGMKADEALRAYSYGDEATLDEDGLTWKFRDLEPVHGGAYDHLTVKWCARRFEEEKEVFLDLAGNKPDDTMVRVHLARLLRSRRDFQGAMSHYHRLIEGVLSRPLRDGDLVLVERGPWEEIDWVLEACGAMAEMSDRVRIENRVLETWLQQCIDVTGRMAGGKAVGHYRKGYFKRTLVMIRPTVRKVLERCRKTLAGLDQRGAK